MSLNDAEQYRLQTLVRKHEAEIEKLKDAVEKLVKMHAPDNRSMHPYVDSPSVY